MQRWLRARGGVGAGDEVEVAATASMRADTAVEDSKGHADGEVRSAVVQRASERVRGPDTKQRNKDEGWELGLLRLRRELVRPPPAR